MKQYGNLVRLLDMDEDFINKFVDKILFYCKSVCYFRG